MKTNSKRTWTVVLSIILALSALGALSFAALGEEAPASYYLCLESQDYRVLQQNKLAESGTEGEFRIDLAMKNGEKFFVSDGAGRMWGSETGGPIRNAKSGTSRIEVRFRPAAAYADTGSHVRYDSYAPGSYTLNIQGAQGEPRQLAMAYRAKQVYDEFVCSEAEVAAGETVWVTDANGGVYGATQTGADADKISFSLTGTYRFVFTIDADNLYGPDRDRYLDYEEVPALYLQPAAGGEIDESARLRRNEDQILYAEYRVETDIPACDYDYSYSVYDQRGETRYLPSSSGKLTVRDKGAYWVCFSFDHAYAADSERSYRTGLVWKEQDYGGYFLIGDANDWTFAPGTEFAERYELVKQADADLDYTEYRIEYTLTGEQLDAAEGSFSFYISDGAEKYRKPTGDNIVWKEAGTYELLFSPDHDYGRLHRYKFTRLSDEPEPEQVRIGSVAEFNAFALACAEDEYSRKKEVLLTADLDFLGAEVTPVPVFNGTFDGCFHTLSNLVVKARGNGAGLFERVGADGEVRRLTVQNLTVDAEDYENAGLVSENEGLLEDLTVSGKVRADRYAGGVAAVNRRGGVLRAVTSRTAVYAVLNAGGVVGFNAGKVVGAVNEGSVNAEEVKTSAAARMINVGGVAGYSTGQLKDCLNRGRVGYSYQGHYVGGVAGLSSGAVYFCRNEAAVDGERETGGVVGYYGRLEQGASGLEDLLKGSPYADWIDKYFGSDDGNFEESEDQGVHVLSYCRNNGTVRAEQSAGGIVGRAGGVAVTVKNCAATGKVTARSSTVGGIVADLRLGAVSDCAAGGEVVCEKGSYAGGIVGSCAGSVEACLSAARVEAKEDFAGGIAGSTSGAVRMCWANPLLVCAGKNTGAVAGNVSDLALCENNYFTGEDLFGVRGVNYGASAANAACKLSAQELLSTPDGMLSPKLVGFADDRWVAAEESRYPVLRHFWLCDEEAGETDFAALFAKLSCDLAEDCRQLARPTFFVTFWQWDDAAEEYAYLADVRVFAGDAVAEADIPKPPELDGCFVWWEETDFSAITANRNVYERFDRYQTTLASDSTIFPQVLVEGRFYSDTTLSVERLGDYYTIKLFRGERELAYADLTVKFLAEEGCTVSRATANGTEELDARRSGKYLCFTISANERFAVSAAEAGDGRMWMFGGIGLAVGAVLCAGGFGTVILLRRKKRRPPAGEDDEQ